MVPGLPVYILTDSISMGTVFENLTKFPENVL